MSEVTTKASQRNQFGFAHPTGTKRFTLDGDQNLESHLADLCAAALRGVRKIVWRYHLEALLLGGGYGRGEGGVLKKEAGDQPYNDLEFYVCLRGNRFLNRRRFERRLARLGERMMPAALVDVEFHIISLAQLRRSRPSMFYYDLVVGHHRLSGEANIFHDCDHHRDPRHLPLAEATRLLMNRGTGLLLAREKLAHEVLSAEDGDFVARNISKAQLALGDAVLTAFGQYHWSCRERHQRLAALPPAKDLPWIDEVRHHHAVGVEFKLHPRRSIAAADILRTRHQRMVELMLPVWLWLESKRLGKKFHSANEYNTSTEDKCPETSPAHNRMINASIFGPAVFFSATSERHPRERILTALSILLWDTGESENRLEKLLCNGSGQSLTEVVNPMKYYRKIWERVR